MLKEQEFTRENREVQVPQDVRSKQCKRKISNSAQTYSSVRVDMCSRAKHVQLLIYSKTWFNIIFRKYALSGHKSERGKVVVRLYESQHTNRNDMSIMIVNAREKTPVDVYDISISCTARRPARLFAFGVKGVFLAFSWN